VRFTGLWRNPDFVKFWSAETISVFGTLMGPLQFTAVLALQASPLQVALLSASGLAPGLLFGLLVGAWVDRLPRRPVLIVADLGRMFLVGSVPAAFLLGALRMEQLYLVNFLCGGLTTFFDVAHHAYVPSLVDREDLVEANSKLAGGASVVEVVAFSAGGWISQLLSAIVAAAIDAVTYLCSALLLLSINKQEPPVSVGDAAPRAILSEITDGVREVWHRPLLRSLAIAMFFSSLGDGVIGAAILLYGVDELALAPGLLGTVFALGGISSAAGAVVTGRVTQKLGIGPAMVWGLLVYGLACMLIPLAQGPAWLALSFLAAQQLSGDGARAIAEINQVSFRQAITPDSLLGRVNGSIRVLDIGFALVGTLLSGAIGQRFGLRAALFTGAGAALSGGLWLALSPVRRVREVASSTE